MLTATCFRSIAVIGILFLNSLAGAGELTPPQVSIQLQRNLVYEGSSDVALVTVKLNEVSTVPVTVTYSIGGTATIDRDYTGPTGSITILPGQKVAVFLVQAYADAEAETTEKIIVTLTGVSDPTFQISTTKTVTINISNVSSTPGTYFHYDLKEQVKI